MQYFNTGTKKYTTVFQLNKVELLLALLFISLSHPLIEVAKVTARIILYYFLNLFFRSAWSNCRPAGQNWPAK